MVAPERPRVETRAVTVRTDTKTAVALALGTFALLWVGAASGSHFDSDDALYAQMAREMARSGDWFDNRWSGVVLFEKPPLVLWALALCGTLGDWTPLALRLPGLLAAAAGVAGLFLLARTAGAERRRALLAALLFGTSGLAMLFSRRLMMDLPLVVLLIFAAREALSRRAWTFGLCAGLCVLTKGPAAAPPLVAIALTAGLGLQSLTISIAVGLAVAAPWHLLETARHGVAFWQGYLGHHVAERLTSSVVPGLSRVELLGTLFDLERALVPLALIGLVVGYRLRTVGERVLVAWLAIVLATLLLSTTRLPQYLMLLLPPLAWLGSGAVPAGWLAHRWAPAGLTAMALVAFLANPAKLTYWLDPDFGPDSARLGHLIRTQAGPDDLVATLDTTTSALTFAADRRIVILARDPRFLEVQNAVHMVRRAEVLRPFTPEALAPPSLAARRFVVCRATDAEWVSERLHAAAPDRTVARVTAGRLVLLHDGTLGAE